MIHSRFLLLESNYMSLFTLKDLEGIEQVKIYHSSAVSNNRIVNILFKIHNSGRINKIIKLPFRGIWGHILFDRLFETFMPDYVVMVDTWVSMDLIHYFRNNFPKLKILLRFYDKVSRSYNRFSLDEIKQLGNKFDKVLVYSDEDAKRYGFVYCPVGYSKTPISLLKPQKRYDVVFIGADKGRIKEIRQAYFKFKESGLSCFFYVIGVPKSDRRNEGIIYSDENMPFLDYLSYENSSNCLFEILQNETSGRTYRLIESIIYNKILVTNCPEVLKLNYYSKGFIQYYKDVAEIDTDFIKSKKKSVNYQYLGEFSPIHDLEFIENLKNEK